MVLGPYATREQAEETGRRIGMPSFIVTAQDPHPSRTRSAGSFELTVHDRNPP